MWGAPGRMEPQMPFLSCKSELNIENVIDEISLIEITRKIITFLVILQFFHPQN